MGHNIDWPNPSDISKLISQTEWTLDSKDHGNYGFIFFRVFTYNDILVFIFLDFLAFIILKSCIKGWLSPENMTAAENVCYTLINVPMDSEPPSEISLKNDLGKLW